VFHVVQLEASRWRVDWARGTTGAFRSADGAAVAGHTGGMLGLSCSSRLLSAARAEREEGVRGDRRVQRQGEVCAWGGTKADGGGLRVRPNVHALAMPFMLLFRA
jgi:hypothetical protein